LPAQLEAEMDWKETLWHDLEALSKPEQIVAAAEIIAQMQTVLEELARHRRVTCVELIEEEGYSYASLAAEIGSRTTSISRLVNQGRVALREEALRNAA